MIRLDAIGGSVADAAAQAMQEGNALLADWNADLLIWGEVKKADEELNLWFLDVGEGTLGAPSYSLTEKLSLPADFETDLGAQLVAVAAAQVAPATERPEPTSSSPAAGRGKAQKTDRETAGRHRGRGHR